MEDQKELIVNNEVETMRFQMDMATTLFNSGVLKFKKVHEVFLILQAGRELGFKYVESLTKLTVIHGKVILYGAGLISEFTKRGVEFSYTDESIDGVTVTAKYGEKVYIEKVLRNDPAFDKSEAIKFTPKNKMRYHGVALIGKFYLPHLIGVDISEDTEYYEINPAKTNMLATMNDIYKSNDNDDLFPDDNPESTPEPQTTHISEDAIIQQLSEFKTLKELQDFYDANKKIITKNIKYTSFYGRMKKSFEV